MRMYGYPAPRAPEYKKPSSVQECLPLARAMINRETGKARMPVKKGDRLLIVTLPDQDKYVAKAVTQATMEAGAVQVDFVNTRELTGQEAEKTSVEDGWRELELLKQGKGSGAATESDLIVGQELGQAVVKYLGKHPEYTGVFCDVAGMGIKRALAPTGKYRHHWAYNNWEEFISRANVFPDDLWKEIERRVVEATGRASKVRITDPEGTHLEFSVTAEEAKRWQMGAWNVSGHIALDPFQATSSDYLRRTIKVPFVLPDVNGVLAGTANHAGFFPHMKTYFEHTRLVGVEGGGKYGEGIAEMMDRYKNVQWPGYPQKGFFWFCDNALGTAVKAARRKSDMFDSYWLYPNMNDKNRAGCLHLGFGNRRHGEYAEAFIKYSEKHKLPTGHIHVHSYFPTFEIKVQGSDRWYKIIDEGWLTCLDDVDIRAMASRYDYPDELLSYDWVPPLPGINCEGDYFKDFAPNPTAYLKKRLAKNQPI